MIILLVFQLTAAVNDFSGLTGGRWYNIDVGNIIYVYIYNPRQYNWYKNGICCQLDDDMPPRCYHDAVIMSSTSFGFSVRHLELFSSHPRSHEVP